MIFLLYEQICETQGRPSGSRRRRRWRMSRARGDDQASFTPRPPNWIWNIATSTDRNFSGGDIAVVEGATAVSVVGPPLDTVVEARYRTFEKAPENTIGGGHIPSLTRRWVYDRSLNSLLRTWDFANWRQCAWWGYIYIYIYIYIHTHTTNTDGNAEL